MNRAQVVTEWRVSAPRASVWDALLDSSRWPSWWRGFRAVERLRGGDERGVGMALRQSWRSALPYTLVLDLEITDVRQRELLAGRVSGDMDGTATWAFEDADDGTLVRFVLDVRPARWWMRLPVPFAERVFRWNFDAVMRWGSQGLAGLLGAGVAHAMPAPRLAAA